MITKLTLDLFLTNTTSNKVLKQEVFVCFIISGSGFISY